MAPATVIGDLFVRLGVDLTAFNKDLVSAENRLESFGTRLFFLGSRVTAGVSVPMIAAGAAVAKFGLDFDKAMTESLAIMQGVTPQIRAEMESVAKTVATTTKFSAKEAAEGYYSLASAGLDAATAMQALPVAANFAQAGVFDLAKATHYLASAQAAMASGTETAQEKVGQMAEVADVLTMANNRALGTVKDFAEALTNRGALAMRQSNMELSEGVAILAAYAERGITGAKAGQQLWMMLRDLQTHALESSKAFEKHNIAIFTGTGALRPMADIIGDLERRMADLTVAQRAQMLVELGIPARSRAATQALVGQSQAIRAHEAAMKSAGGTAKTVADEQMKALSNQFLRIRNEIQNAAIELFQAFIPALRDYVIPLGSNAAAALHALAQGFKQLPEPLQAVIVGGMALIAVVGPLTAMIGSMSLLLAASMRGITAVTSGWGKMATQIGLAAGGTNWLAMSTTQLQAAQTQAAKAAIAAAMAQGQNAFQANSAGAAALRATRIAQQQAMATAASTSATTQLAKVFGIGATAAVSFATKIGGLVGSFLKWTAIIEIFGPAAKRLITGWDDFAIKSDQATEGTEEHTSALDILSGAFQFFNDVVGVAGGGLDMLVREIQLKAMTSYQGLASDITKATKGLADFRLETEKSPDSFDRMANSTNLLSERVDTVADKINALRVAWGRLVLETENRDIPDMDALGAEMQRGFLNAARDKNKQKDPFAAFMPKLPPEAFWSTSDYERNKGKGAFPSAEGTEKLTAAERAANKLRDELLGVNDEAVKLKGAWDRLTPSQRANLAVQLNLWDAYSKLRGEAGGMIPAFERLFASQLEQLRITSLIDAQTKDYSNTWSDAATQVMIDAGKMHAAVTGMSDPQMAAFWKEHESVMEELAPRYGELDSSVQHLVRRYQEWKMALPLGKEFTEPAQRAMQAMDDLLRETTAKMADLQSDIHQFSESAGETHRRTVRNKLEQIKADQEKVLRERLKDLGRFTGEEHATYVAGLNQLRRDQQKYVEDYERYETLRYMQSIGVNAKILRDHKKYTQEKLNELTKEQEAWNRFMRDLQSAATGIAAMGSIVDMLGLNELGASLQGVGAGTAKIFEGLDQFRNAENLGQKIAAVATSLEGLVQAYKALADTAGRGNRALSGAASGAMIGAQFGGGWGAVIGAGIGAIAGLVMGDPSWEKMRKAVEKQWNVNVSKELAKQIDQTAQQTGNRTIAMFRHLGQIIEENGGINPGSVRRWGRTLADAFTQVGRGALPAWEAARALDDTFGDLVQSGTATSGMVNAQIVELVRLERQYRTGSTAIKEFVDAQLGMASGGFNKVVDAFFGTMIKSLNAAEDADAVLEKTNGLNQKAAKLAAQIADFEKEGIKNEKQRVAYSIAKVELARTEFQIKEAQAKQAAADAAISRMAGEDGQRRFDQMGQLAGVMFQAAMAGGRGLFEALEAIGPALDTLIIAQKAFGFESNEAFSSLMRLREFATINPELVAAIGGLSEMMVGLHNAGFMTQSAFSQLGAVVTATFDELIAKGLTGEEAMQAMHQPLQRLWEMQRMFGYAVDEATQKLIDEAVASGAVGVKFMSATDRMVLGIDTLIGRFDLFLQHLGIRIPSEAANAAAAIEDEFSGIDIEEIEVPYKWTARNERPGNPSEPIPLADGGVLNRPTFVAGEAGAEVVMPLDRLFNEIEAMNRAQYAVEERAVKIYLDGRKVAEGLIPHNARVIRKHRLDR